FILLSRKQLPPDESPSQDKVYDDRLQLWINRQSGLPVIEHLKNQKQTQFGETVETRTREGIHQPEGAMLEASRFGETTLTDSGEGADQPERASLDASRYGETLLTKTREGADQAETAVFRASQHGETLLTMTREGADQSENVALKGPDAPYSP